MKLINCHSHKVLNDGNITVYNIRINKETLRLPHGPDIYFSVGIHPWDAAECKMLWFDQLTMLLNYQQVVALGECGLDKKIDIPFDQQLLVFEKQIVASETMRKPVIIHCVGYFNELMEIKKRINPTQAWIIHGFRGKPQLAQQLIQQGFYISYGEKLNPESVIVTPTNSILTETDESDQGIQALSDIIAGIKGCEATDFRAASVLFGI